MLHDQCRCPITIMAGEGWQWFWSLRQFWCGENHHVWWIVSSFLADHNAGIVQFIKQYGKWTKSINFSWNSLVDGKCAALGLVFYWVLRLSMRRFLLVLSTRSRKWDGDHGHPPCSHRHGSPLSTIISVYHPSAQQVSSTIVSSPKFWLHNVSNRLRMLSWPWLFFACSSPWLWTITTITPGWLMASAWDPTTKAILWSAWSSKMDEAEASPVRWSSSSPTFPQMTVGQY